MARFLTPAWAEEVTAALRELPELPAPDGTSLVAGDGRFTVTQEVHDVPAELGAPGNVVRTVLRVEDGRATLGVEAGRGGTEEEDPAAAPNVTLSIGYEHAAALNRGELEPAAALARGLVRVRGDLGVLVAGQDLLTTAGERLRAVLAATEY